LKDAVSGEKTPLAARGYQRRRNHPLGGSPASHDEVRTEPGR